MRPVPSQAQQVPLPLQYLHTPLPSQKGHCSSYHDAAMFRSGRFGTTTLLMPVPLQKAHRFVPLQ
jgi:hypothetical protein